MGCVWRNDTRMGTGAGEGGLEGDRGWDSNENSQSESLRSSAEFFWATVTYNYCRRLHFLHRNCFHLWSKVIQDQTQLLSSDWNYLTRSSSCLNYYSRDKTRREALCVEKDISYFFVCDMRILFLPVSGNCVFN